MSFEQKEWKNRLSEYPTRRTLTPTDGGTPMEVDVARSEGTVMQQGDPFNADNMNDLERRIAEGIGGGETTIAPTEVDPSENAYVVGDKLIFDGVLYKVISPISVGNSLVPGTNISPTTVTELINILENELTANNTRIYMDYKNGKYGINTSSARGADTFIPFKGSSTFTLTISFSASTTGNVTQHDEDSLTLSTSSTFAFTETSTVRVKTYSVSGVSVSHSGSTWSFSKSISGGGRCWRDGYNTSISGSGSATITFEYTPA